MRTIRLEMDDIDYYKLKVRKLEGGYKTWLSMLKDKKTEQSKD
jgi:hypothetical protein